MDLAAAAAEEEATLRGPGTAFAVVAVILVVVLLFHVFPALQEPQEPIQSPAEAARDLAARWTVNLGPARKRPGKRA